MRSVLKKHLSIFLLGIFLFAYTEKSAHDILHADDMHCNAQHEKHFHDQEHHCFICDFTISLFDNTSNNSESSFLRHTTDAVFAIAESTFSYSASHSSFTRGPPALA
jgi:hypothetical protein